MHILANHQLRQNNTLFGMHLTLITHNSLKFNSMLDLTAATEALIMLISSLDNLIHNKFIIGDT